MKQIKIILIIACCLSFFIAKGQPVAGSGCMTTTNPNRVYQQSVGTYNGKPTYSFTPPYSEWTVQYDITDYPCFKWVPTGNGQCYLRSGYWPFYSYTAGNAGYFYGVSGTNCPIDDYILPFLILVAGVSFFHIKKGSFEIA